MSGHPRIVDSGAVTVVATAVALAVVFAAVFGVVLFAGFVTSGCGQQPVTDSGVQGEVRIGPVQPVERPGVPNDAPYSATLRIKRASGGELVAETKSAADGSFRVALAPGDYVLEPVNGEPLPTAQAQEFTVEPGRFTTVNIAYDSGIR
jgi:hypothetical protein